MGFNILDLASEVFSGPLVPVFLPLQKLQQKFYLMLDSINDWAYNWSAFVRSVTASRRVAAINQKWRVVTFHEIYLRRTAISSSTFKKIEDSIVSYSACLHNFVPTIFSLVFASKYRNKKSPYETKCTETKNLAGFLKYDSDGCYYECLSNTTGKKCGCRLPSLVDSGK